MNTQTITGELFAYLTGDNGPEELRDQGVKCLTLSPYSGMGSVGWTLVGNASITVEIPDERQLVENKVESLKAEATKLRAETEARLTEIDRKINTLLAITFEAPSDEPGYSVDAAGTFKG